MIERERLQFDHLDKDALEELGGALASVLMPGDVLCLTGDLGAGKTTLSQAILKALGVTDHVTSPTYTLMNLYQVSSQTIWHMDAYRIRDLEELHELGFYDVLHTEAILLIEWADIIKEEIPEKALWIELHYDDHRRNMTFEGHSHKLTSVKEALDHVHTGA